MKAINTNLVFLIHGDISKIVRKTISKYMKEPDISVTLRDTLDPIKDAMEIINKNKESIIISSGIYARYLQTDERITIPVVAIKPTLHDILMAVKAAYADSPKIAVIALTDYIPDFKQILPLLNIVPQVISIRDYTELPGIMMNLKTQGDVVVIGSSMVCSAAREFGLKNVNIWSESSVQLAINSAIEIANAKKQILVNNRMLDTILSQSYRGIIYVDNNGLIRIFNDAALKLFKLTDTDVIGQNISDLLPDIPIEHVLSSSEAEIEHVINLLGDAVLVNYNTFLDDKKMPIGKMISLQYAKEIQKSEERYRRRLYKKDFTATTMFTDILGKSSQIREIKTIAEHYAHTNSSILITGETGVGKELFAQSIHNESPRKDKPFVVANCAAIPSNLIESELFGYEEGAFTGAKKEGKYGFFELAHGGTLFLDEIGEMPLPMQSRLLRVLEEKEILRVGGESLRYVDVRILAATNRDLSTLVEKECFRKDLYYRLNVLELYIPPLRTRLEDIQVLASKFLSELRRDLTAEEVFLISNSPVLKTYVWPGNIRELRNIMERFSAMYNKKTEYNQVLSTLLFPHKPIVPSVLEHESMSLQSCLEKYNGNRTLAARELGISRTTLWRQMKNENLL